LAIGYPFFNTTIPHKRHLTKGFCIYWPAAVIPYLGEVSSRLRSSRSLAIIGHSAFVKRNLSIKVKGSRSINLKRINKDTPSYLSFIVRPLRFTFNESAAEVYVTSLLWFNNLEATLRQKKVARTTFLNSKRPPSTKSPLTPAFTTNDKQEEADTDNTFYVSTAFFN
ncbi:hypothetical protein CI238_11606, partial [Colletotrichum incanum]